MKNIKAIIFDMDGTLLDSLSVWADSDKELITSFGHEYSHTHSLAMKTMHFDSACDYLVETFKLPLSSEETGERILQMVEYKYLHEINLRDGALDFIKAVHNKGVKMCVATSNKKTLAEGALKSHGLMDYMEFVLTSDEVGCGKESPLIFEKAAEMLGAAPSETAVFEDSIHAVNSAKSAGFYTVGVYDPLSEEEFRQIESTAHRTIKSYSELEI